MTESRREYGIKAARHLILLAQRILYDEVKVVSYGHSNQYSFMDNEGATRNIAELTGVVRYYVEFEAAEGDIDSE